jgi:hypothetical protein
MQHLHNPQVAVVGEVVELQRAVLRRRHHHASAAAAQRRAARGPGRQHSHGAARGARGRQQAHRRGAQALQDNKPDNREPAEQSDSGTLAGWQSARCVAARLLSGRCAHCDALLPWAPRTGPVCHPAQPGPHAKPISQHPFWKGALTCTLTSTRLVAVLTTRTTLSACRASAARNPSVRAQHTL